MQRTKVLVVDDIASVREAVRAILEMDNGLEVVGEAEDGEEAFRKAMAIRPDIVLMDVSMPKIDGLRATQMIREALPATGVILVTFHDITTDQLDECGADAYVQKGASPNDILTAIWHTRMSVLLDTELNTLPLVWKKVLAWLALENHLPAQMVEEMARFCKPSGDLDIQTLAKNYVSEETLASAIAFATGLPIVSLTPYSPKGSSSADKEQMKTGTRKIDPVQLSAAKMVSSALASDLCLVPIAIVDNEIMVAMANPLDSKALNMVEQASGMKVRPVISTISEIQDAIQRVFYRLTTSSILSCLLSKDNNI